MTEGSAPEHPILAGALVTLRRLVDADRPRLVEILSDPEVRHWWGPEDPNVAADDMFDDDAVGFAIEVDGVMVGGIQYAEENEPGYRHAGIDVFLGSNGRGRGYGPDAVRTLARYLFEVRGHHRLTIDPAAANERAIRTYERVGFRPVGVMRQYERGHDGEFHDGLLMDMLREELR
jgi:aminoglycoside 6'-N-acetyltransferase